MSKGWEESRESQAGQGSTPGEKKEGTKKMSKLPVPPIGRKVSEKIPKIYCIFENRFCLKIVSNLRPNNVFL